MRRVEAFQELLPLRIPRAQHDQRQILPYQGLGSLFEQVEALLSGQPRHHADQRQVQVRGRKVERRQQVCLAGALARQVAGRVIGGDLRIGGGVPLAVVHAVEDSPDRIAARLQDAIQCEAQLRRLDLARVGRAHGRDRIAQQNATFEQVDVAEKLQAAGREEAAVQAYLGQRRRRKQPLVTEVVDGQHHRQAHERRVAGKHGALEDRDQRGLPVVAVDDVGAEHVPDHGQRHARQHGKPDVVVGVIFAAGVAVQAVAIVERRAVHQEVGHLALGHRMHVGGVFREPQPHAQVLVQDRRPLNVDAAVTRHEHGHVLAAGGERRRERADHVGQASGLGKRRRFRSNHQDSGHLGSILPRRPMVDGRWSSADG